MAAKLKLGFSIWLGVMISPILWSQDSEVETRAPKLTLSMAQQTNPTDKVPEWRLKSPKQTAQLALKVNSSQGGVPLLAPSRLHFLRSLPPIPDLESENNYSQLPRPVPLDRAGVPLFDLTSLWAAPHVSFPEESQLRLDAPHFQNVDQWQHKVMPRKNRWGIEVKFQESQGGHPHDLNLPVKN